jgi:hypothetical protein
MVQEIETPSGRQSLDDLVSQRSEMAAWAAGVGLSGWRFGGLGADAGE